MLLQLRFDSKTVKEPIISRVAIKTGVPINILKADVGARKGEIIVEIPDDKSKEIESLFLEMGVEVHEITKSIARNDDCVHCGLCISICPTEVFQLNSEMMVEIKSEKCIHCGACVKVCPTMALYFPI
uniref:4Fe-4S dicluster domain-containing protein n=1 Tax=Archaeoglobus fulgidus TaxID=2234 RepID=A0A7J2TJP4_ARCFL